MVVGSLIFVAGVALAVVPFRRPPALGTASWIIGALTNELPFLVLLLIAISVVPSFLAGELPDGGVAALVLNLVAVVLVGIVIARSARSGPVLQQALDRALGTGWRDGVTDPRAPRPRRHLPWLRIVLFPIPVRPRDVERISNVRYGAKPGKTHLLDVYRHRSRPTNSPTLIHLHGGRFRWGGKSRETRPLLHHLARQGWTCISANYQLTRTPGDGFPEHLIDVKRLLAWARSEGRERHGVDVDTIVLSGSSAGAHLTAMAALTPNDPRFQPGFEAADTSVLAGICLYGYYGSVSDGPIPSEPAHYLRPDAPPFLVLHGTNDTVVSDAGARDFAAALSSASQSPVAFADLPGAQHSFDLTHSIRFESVVSAAEAFLGWVLAQRTR